MRRDLQHIQLNLENGARQVAEKYLEGTGQISVKHIGNEHISLPAFLITDPILEPVDKIVYCIIRTLSPKTLASDESVYPTYDDICRYANIGSHATVAKALHVLRLTRWLISKQVRSSKGIMSNVYMTLDQPMDVIDMIELDETYLDYVTDSMSHNHNRVSQVASVLLSQHESNTLHGKTAPSHPLTETMEATDFMRGQKETTYFGCSPDAIQRLKESRYSIKSVKSNKTNTNISSLDNEEGINSEGKPSSVNEENNSRTVMPDYIRSLTTEENKNNTKIGSSVTKEGENYSSSVTKEPCSRSSYSIKTTTKAGPRIFYASIEPDADLMELIDERLINLSQQHRIQIARYIMRINEIDRSPMVFELSNRMKYGDKPVKNPVAYVGKLCSLLKKGETPFTEFAFEDFNPDATPEPLVDPCYEVKQEIGKIDTQLAEAWSDYQAMKLSYEREQTDIAKKLMQNSKHHFESLQLEKRKLSSSLETIKLTEEQANDC